MLEEPPTPLGINSGIRVPAHGPNSWLPRRREPRIQTPVNQRRPRTADHRRVPVDRWRATNGKAPRWPRRERARHSRPRGSLLRAPDPERRSDPCRSCIPTAGGARSCIRCNNTATTRSKVNYGRNLWTARGSSCLFCHRDVMRDSGQPGPALTLEHFRSVSCDR